jgi:hypothetical protein
VINEATFADDAGAVYAASGLPLSKIASNPATGQYSVANGVYTFAAADEGKAVLLTYSYGIVSTGQKIAVVNNQLIGTTPTFQALFYTSFQGQAVTLQLNNCISNKLTFGTKLEDFVMPEFDFACFADTAGNVMTWSFAEAS